MAFKTLKSNVRDFSKQQNALSLLFKKQAILQFHNNFSVRLTKSAKVLMMTCARDRKTMQQSFKALLEYQLSQKLY